MENEKPAEPVLSIEEDGHRRWLCVTEGELTAKLRLPLHVDKMNHAQKEFFMHNACIELRDKLLRMKQLGTIVN